MSSATALSGREDVSRFLVHLTRDDRDDYSDGGSAKGNLLSILRQKEIRAIAPHCLFNPRLKRLPRDIRREFRTACFTEAPLNQLHLLVQDIPGRRVKLEPYEICFSKDFIVEAGGQPAIYVNSYDRNFWLRDCVDDIYDAAVTQVALNEPLWRILPFINAMNERYDFSWEREWRVLGGLRFTAKDIVCLILPGDREEPLKERMASAGIAVISPGWTYEQIVAELAKQQRSTRSLSRAVQRE